MKLALMDCPLNNTFLLTLQYSKGQTRGEEIEKCVDEGLEPTYYFSIFDSNKNFSFNWWDKEFFPC